MTWETAAENLPLTHGTAVFIGAIITIAVIIALATAFSDMWKDAGPLRTVVVWGGEAALIGFFFLVMKHLGWWSIPATLGLGVTGFWAIEWAIPSKPRDQRDIRR